MLEIELNMEVEETDEVSMSVEESDEVRFGVGEAITIRDHSILTNRDLADQHPISAITGLEEALAQIPSLDGIIWDCGTASGVV